MSIKKNILSSTRPSLFKPAGFTLVEIMVTLVIVGIFAGVTYFSFTSGADKQKFNTSLNIFESAFKDARNFALSGVTQASTYDMNLNRVPLVYGLQVSINSNKLVFLTLDETMNGKISPKIKEIFLATDTKITDVNEGNTCFFFLPPRGELLIYYNTNDNCFPPNTSTVDFKSSIQTALTSRPRSFNLTIEQNINNVINSASYQIESPTGTLSLQPATTP